MENNRLHHENQPPHLPITLNDELLIEITAQNSRIRSILVGMEHNNYVVAKIFPKDLVGVFNSEGIKKSPITVMYRYKGIVYRFDSTIQHVVNFPSRVYFLKYPEEVKSHCVPEKIRHKCILPSQAMIGNDILDMTIVDISHNGCLCIINTTGEENNNLNEMIHVDNRIEIMMQFQGPGERHELVGTMRNFRKDINQIQLGVMFGEMPPVVKKVVEDYIAFISKSGKISMD